MRWSDARIVLVPAIAFVLLLGAYAATGSLESQTVSRWAGVVTIDSPTTLQAGDSAIITVSASASDGTRVQLGVFAPVNSVVLESFLVNRKTEFILPAEMTRHAGVLRLAAQIDMSQSQTGSIIVSPLAPVDPVVPLVGPRTMIADGADKTMTVVIPTDPFGNPAVAGTEVAIELLRPNGTRETITEAVERGIAATTILSTTEAGRVIVSATTETAEGPGNVVDQVAGIPASFSVRVDDRNTFADGFTLHQVETSLLLDQFGNVLPDGISALFLVEDDNGVALVQSVVQGGHARAMIEAPNQTGDVSVRARVSGAESDALVVFFNEAIDTISAVAVNNGNDLVITVGPVLAARGGYVPDGTEVIIQTVTTGETIGRGAFRTGVAQITVDSKAPRTSADAMTTAPLVAVVLGTTTPITTAAS